MAFGRGALPFAVAYVVVRGIGLALYVWVAWTDRAQRAAVMRFTTASVAGLAAVIVGAFAEDTLRYALWGVAIILDIVAAMVGADVSGWNLHPEHFAERHGLFTIIALGETLVVAASGATRADWSGDLIASALLAVAVTSGFWWIYFARAKPLLDAVLESATDIDRSRLGRDVFSLLHFPVVCGVVACAAVVEAAISHPHHPLTVEQRGTLAIGLVLYAGGMAVAARRAGVSGFGPRLLVVATTAIVVVVIGGVLPAVSLGVVFGGTLIVAVVEHIRLPAPHVASRFETN
jgi:low temperature requirement protein LtrA